MGYTNHVFTKKMVIQRTGYLWNWSWDLIMDFMGKDGNIM